MKVREIMTTGVATATLASSLTEIATLMKNEDTGAIPVVENNELLGIITDRDIVLRCVAEGKNPAAVTAEEIISESLETVEPDEEVGDASRLMAQKQVRRLPVVENGRLIGMLSLGDIAVKQSDVRQTGDTLQSVSQGVKPSRAARAKPAAERNRTDNRAALRQEQERSGQRMVTGGTRAPQGISNRDIQEESKRQEKVVSIRNQGKTTRKRKAS